MALASEQRETLFHEMAHFDLMDRNAAALKVVKSRRESIYDEPYHLKGRMKRTVAGKKESNTERERRKRIRGLNEELSRYYELEDDDDT